MIQTDIGSIILILPTFAWHSDQLQFFQSFYGIVIVAAFPVIFFGFFLIAQCFIYGADIVICAVAVDAFSGAGSQGGRFFKFPERLLPQIFFKIYYAHQINEVCMMGELRISVF